MFVQSIVKKHLELQAVVDIYDPDIITITETWLNSKISDIRNIVLRVIINQYDKTDLILKMEEVVVFCFLSKAV